MTNPSQFLERCQQEEVKFLDLKSVDLRGSLHHLSIPVSQLSDVTLMEGVGFDGSSYGFAKTENSDMVLIPDLKTAAIDPFRSSKTISCFCSIHIADDKRTRFDDDVRYVCEKADNILQETEIADTSRWAPEFEFNIFEAVDYKTAAEEAYYIIQSGEQGNGNAYHACNPDDQYADFRDEVVELIESMGIGVRYHHHEVGSFGQQEIEANFEDILKTGDNSLTIRYLLRNLADREGLALTLMPKPIFGQAGNGWHLHQFLLKNDVNIFYQPGEYGNLSKTALYYIGGILKHGPAIMAFTNPSTNSYKRLVPGFEAPVALTYGMANRAGAIRIPAYVNDPAMVRIEYRPPDATANPYLCPAAILMAGIDGIINKIDPAKSAYGPYDFDVSQNPKILDSITFLPRTLNEALDALEKDNEFLTRNSVFQPSLLKRWTELKREEVRQYLLRPHPYEFDSYFSF